MANWGRCTLTAQHLEIVVVVPVERIPELVEPSIAAKLKLYVFPMKELVCRSQILEFVAQDDF